MGLVGDHFTKRSVIEPTGQAMFAIGHVRYSTTGDTVIAQHVQPLFADLDDWRLRALPQRQSDQCPHPARRPLIEDGRHLPVHHGHRGHHPSGGAFSAKGLFVEKFHRGAPADRGAYSFVGLTNKKLIGARDPLGIRPLVLGQARRLLPSWLRRPARSTSSAPSSCARSKTAIVVIITKDGIESHHPFPS